MQLMLSRLFKLNMPLAIYAAAKRMANHITQKSDTIDQLIDQTLLLGFKADINKVSAFNRKPNLGFWCARTLTPFLPSHLTIECEPAQFIAKPLVVKYKFH